jgi:eukaryotic-like serine/threonine-protein kinase
MPLQPGERLGRYEILALIGVGGMGDVYKARDMRLKRIVAIKRLKGHDSSRKLRHSQRSIPDRLA